VATPRAPPWTPRCGFYGRPGGRRLTDGVRVLLAREPGAEVREDAGRRLQAQEGRRDGPGDRAHPRAGNAVRERVRVGGRGGVVGRGAPDMTEQGIARSSRTLVSTPVTCYEERDGSRLPPRRACRRSRGGADHPGGYGRD